MFRIVSAFTALAVALTALSGCGDKGPGKAAEGFERAMGESLGAQGVVATPLVRADRESVRYSGGAVTWSGEAAPGRATAFEVALGDADAKPSDIYLRDVAFANGTSVGLLRISPFPERPARVYDATALSTGLWGLSLRIGRLVVRDEGETMEVALSDASIEGGDGCLPAAFSARWGGKGPVSGKVRIQRANGGIQIVGRLGPAVDEVSVRGLLSDPGARKGADGSGTALDLPMRSPGNLVPELLTLGFLADPPDMRDAPAASLATACADIARGARVGLMVKGTGESLMMLAGGGTRPGSASPLTLAPDPSDPAVPPSPGAPPRR